MSVTNEENKVSYIADGGASYDIPFYFESAEHIKLYIDDIEAAFTASGAGDLSGGVLTVAGTPPIAPSVVTILRRVPIKQENSFTEGGPFLAKTVEKMFDRLTHISQQVNERVSRAIKLPVSSTVDPELTGEVTPRGMLVLNADATAVEIGPNVDTYMADVLAAAGEVTVNTENSISAMTAAQAAALASQASETAADASADAAALSAASADASADSAALSELNAATSAQNAGTSELNALAYRNTASTHATTATTQAGNATNASTYSAEQAALAQTARTQAQTAATSASDSAAAAAASAIEAAENIAATDEDITVTANDLNKTLNQAILDGDIGGSATDDKVTITANNLNKTLKESIEDYSFFSQAIPYPMMSGWTSFTPTGTWTTNTGYEGFYRRVGDSVEIQYRLLLSGIPDNVALQLDMPNGIVADANKITALGVGGNMGSAYLFDASSSASRMTTSAGYRLSVNQIIVHNVNSSTTPIAWASGDVISVFLSVPVQGWTASSPHILTVPETFSTDTAPLVFKSSEVTANDPIGTFSTYSYAINTNTRTVNTTAPTQTIADMKANGIRVYSRAYNAPSTAGNPAAIAIQIGKGMKGVTKDFYKSSGKTTQGNLDAYVTNGNVTQIGALIKDYNEATGILLVDAGWCQYATVTSTSFLFSDLTGQTNGYLVINASKNPALTGMNVETVAARGVNTSGQSIPNSATIMTITSKTFDTHGALSLTGEFTVPVTGSYTMKLSATFASSVYSAGNFVAAYLYIDNAVYSILDNPIVVTTFSQTVTVNGHETFYATKGQVVDVRLRNNRGSTPLTTGDGYNVVSYTKTSIG